MRSRASAIAFARTHRGRFIDELSAFIRYPSVGSDRRHAGDVAACARWLAAHLTGLGLPDVRILPTRGHPLVFASTAFERGRPVILVYGHYDVQPAGPLQDWHTPPFTPVRQGPWLFGRGASDDKGQLFAHVKGVEAWLRSGGTPVTVKFMLDGEEEIGSPSLPEGVARYRALLKADVALVSDSPMLGTGRPVITTSLRGSLGFDVDVRVAEADLHSGIFGGAIPDPIQALCRALASLQDERGRVVVSRFHTGVRRLPREEQRALAAVAPTNAAVINAARADSRCQDDGTSLFENTTVRPSLTVTGISGGHVGPGDRTVIAGAARARINVRLAPDQDPDLIATAVEHHLVAAMPRCVKASIHRGRSVKPYRIPLTHPAVRAAIEACRLGFERAPALLPMGGSIAAVPVLQDLLGIPSVLIGFALPDDGKHAANERLHLPTLERAIETSIHFLAEVA